MSKGFLEELADYLIIYASDVVTENGVDLFWDKTPDEPDNCVSLHEYDGAVNFAGNDLLRSVQVRVRNTSYENARININIIFDLLYNPDDDVRFIQINPTRWIQVSPRTPPYKLARDETGREIFIFNMGVRTNRDS